jgi:magnesium transporter
MSNELALCLAYIDAHAEDAARAIERLPASEAAALLAAMSPLAAARALAVMMPAFAADCLERLDAPAAAAMLAGVHAGRAALLLRQLDAAARGAILKELPRDEALMLGALLRYPAGTAGALMDSRVFTASESLRIGDALAAMRRLPRDVHDYMFVVDDRHRLVGIVGLRELMSARAAEPLASVANRSIGRVPASAGRAVVLRHVGWRQFRALAVVDDESVLIGAISHESVRALADEGPGPTGQDVAETVFALGELYWVGVAGVLDGVASAVRSALLSAPETGEVRDGAR